MCLDEMFEKGTRISRIRNKFLYRAILSLLFVKAVCAFSSTSVPSHTVTTDASSSITSLNSSGAPREVYYSTDAEGRSPEEDKINFHFEDGIREKTSNLTLNSSEPREHANTRRTQAAFDSSESTCTNAKANSKDARPCIPLCCSKGKRISNNTCVDIEDPKSNFTFPAVYDLDLEPTDLKVNEDHFAFLVRDPCNGGQKYRLDPEEFEEDAFQLLKNGSIYQPVYQSYIEPTKYCFGVNRGSTFDVVLCFPDDAENEADNDSYAPRTIGVGFPVGLVVSTPFLLVTLLVYTVIPELRNLHGFTLRGYVGSLCVAYLVLAFLQLSAQENISDNACVFIAFIIYFAFLASFFWLNVMCFDIWWTFGGFRALQGSMKQRERKKFIIYSIYAWGSASLLTAVCIVMDFAPSIPKDFIRPKFGSQSCWFYEENAKALYFYGPMGVTIVCNICLFISTAFKIIQHKKDTAHHLKGSESRRHDDNKQWFNLYLKLFIVMGINWSMEIVSWLCQNTPKYIWFITDLANALQGLIIFIIFVWKDKIKRLLMKRFRCTTRNVLSRNSTRSAYHSSTSRTCTTSTVLQEKVNPSVQLQETSYKNKISSEDSDCV